MTHWNEIEKIFNEALLVETGARAVFLDGACAGDAALRAEVESLLASMNEAESFLEHPPVPEITISDHGPRLSVGQPVSHYKIVSHIATGGMGEVYLAEDQKLRRKVALKVLNEQMLADGEQIRRFRREANAISALNHPNILTIFEFDAADDINFIASEYVEGETLRERLRRGPMPMREALDVSIQTLNALNTAHRAGIVHRDIKPENIMIRDDGYVKVLDFGLAKRTRTPPLSAEAETLLYVRSHPGVIVGTVKYMSPEQARGKVVDERSDIFSFGTVLYEMLAGKPPFTGETSADVMASILQSDAPSLVSVVPETSAELDGVIGKALSKSASDRYQSSSELLDELQVISKLLEADSSAGFAGRLVSARDGASVIPDDRDALVGRDTEIHDVISLLRRSDVRLVTLTGIGGTGKTRLSRAVAERLGGEFAGGSVFVELSCVRDPEMVGAAIAQSLGVPEIGGDDVIETIRTALRERPTLLVLDNFEQVVAYSPRIADLIADIPGSKILATSRELLHLSAEVEYAVPPLAIPENDDSSTAAEARRFESVLLFERRARRADPHFELTDENAGQVTEICSRLDGLPLAIELAAARAKVLSPAEILSKLDDRFSLLTGGAKDLPDRQRTIRGAIEWSYDLLSEDEKELFRRLSVFAGGFTNKTAEAVLLRTGFSTPAADGSTVRTSISGSQSIGLLDLVTSLADKSLLVVKRGRSGERRFVMLDTVREYAAAAFSETDIANDMRLSHAEYFLELAETASPYLKGPDSREWLPRLEDEHDNIRGALKWAIESVPEIAARLAAAIRHLWTIHGHLHEGRRWSAEVLSRDIDMPDTTRWEILTVYGILSQFQGDLEKADALYQEALDIGTRSDDKVRMSQSLRGLAALAYMGGAFASARELIQKAVTFSREANDDFGLGAALGRLADIANAEGDFVTARSLTTEALRIFRKLGYREGVSTKLNSLGSTDFSLGEYDVARAHFDEALAVAAELEEKINTRLIFDGFAALAAQSGDFINAARLAGFAESLGASVGYAREPAEVLFRDKYMAKVRAALDDAEFDAEYNTGRKLCLEDATKLTHRSSIAGRPSR